MANIIKIKRSTTTATPSSLEEGELAYSENSGKLFYGDSNGNIKTIGGLPASYLPEASASVLGGIKVGDNLSITSGVLAAEAGIGTKGADIASANTMVIPTTGDYFDVTGTTTISTMTVAADRHFTLQFDGAVLLGHNATNLDLPSEGSITTAAGDVATFQSTGANTVQCINYTRADGTAIVSYTHPTSTGNKHIPTGGSSEKFLKWSANGNATWEYDNNTVYSLPAATNSTIGGMYTLSASGINLSTVGGTAGQIFLKLATVAEKGGIRLTSDTVQSVNANSVSNVSTRTYGIQLAALSKAVVNVPWTDTVYTHPNHSGDVVSTADGATVIQVDAVDIPMLSATGTASSTTFLRGDNSWVTPTDTTTDTTYSAGTGLTLTGTTFSAASLALTSVQTASTQAAQLLLTTEQGDVVVRSDENKTYIHNGGSAGTMADFTLLSTPTADLTAVTVSGAITGGGTSGSVAVGHSSANGYKHIPSDGATGELLRYTSAGTAVWSNGGTYLNTAGLVRRDSSGISYFTKLSAVGGSSNIALQLGGGGFGDTEVQFHDDDANVERTLKWDNSSSEFQIEDSSNVMRAISTSDTVYSHPTTAGNKHVPTGGASGQLLGYSSNGTAAWTDTIDGGTY